MKNQWTTIADNTKKEVSKSPSDESRKNRKIALALASIGVFLVMVGAAPFFFQGDSSDYSAFMGDGLSNDTVYQPAGSIQFDDGDEIVTEEEPIEIDIDIPVDEIAIEEVAETPIVITIPDAEYTEVTDLFADSGATETEEEEGANLSDETFSNPEVILEDGSGSIDISEISVITETEDFPINTYTGEVVDPIDLARTATAEQLHGSAEESPGTGLPILPLLAFSAAAAFLARKRKALR